MKLESLLLYNLGVRHGLALEKLIKNDGVPVRALQCKHLSTTHLSYTLDRLEEVGFIQRKRGRKDRRVVFIHLTDKGREFMQESTNQKQESGVKKHEATISKTKRSFWIF